MASANDVNDNVDEMWREYVVIRRGPEGKPQVLFMLNSPSSVKTPEDAAKFTAALPQSHPGEDGEYFLQLKPNRMSEEFEEIATVAGLLSYFTVCDNGLKIKQDRCIPNSQCTYILPTPSPYLGSSDESESEEKTYESKATEATDNSPAIPKYVIKKKIVSGRIHLYPSSQPTESWRYPLHKGPGKATMNDELLAKTTIYKETGLPPNELVFFDNFNMTLAYDNPTPYQSEDEDEFYSLVSLVQIIQALFYTGRQANKTLTEEGVAYRWEDLEALCNSTRNVMEKLFRRHADLEAYTEQDLEGFTQQDLEGTTQQVQHKFYGDLEKHLPDAAKKYAKQIYHGALIKEVDGPSGKRQVQVPLKHNLQ